MDTHYTTKQSNHIEQCNLNDGMSLMDAINPTIPGGSRETTHWEERSRNMKKNKGLKERDARPNKIVFNVNIRCSWSIWKNIKKEETKNHVHSDADWSMTFLSPLLMI